MVDTTIQRPSIDPALPQNNITPQNASDSPFGLEFELEQLRGELAQKFILLFPLLAWTWFGYVMFTGADFWPDLLPSVLAMATGAILYRSATSHPKNRSRIVTAGLIATQVSLFYCQPRYATAALALLVVVLVHALLKFKVASVATLMLFGANVFVYFRSSASIPFPFTEAIITFWLSFATAALANRALIKTTEYSLRSWQRSQDALNETRQRRAEVYRAMRALEEANERIRRMNSELLAARREAELAKSLKARFAATVSHELRAPLNVILGFSSMMILNPERYPEPLPDAYLQDIDAIYRSSQHIASLIDDILDLSQIEAESMTLIKDRIWLQSDVIPQAIDVVRPLAERKNLALLVQVPKDLPWVLADSIRLRQVLLNLLMNAVRFTSKGKVIVRAGINESAVWVSVQDTGAGISDQDLPRVFREFEQLNVDREANEKGSGLGLSIARHLVRLHGGDIWVDSKEGQGATFTFSVPLPGRDQIANRLRSTSLQAKQHPIWDTCLVVHDDPTVLRILGRLLQNWRIVGVPTPDLTDSLIKQLHPRAILSHGDHVAKLKATLKKNKARIPLIRCDLPRSTPPGNDNILAYLVKPISESAIRSIMSRFKSKSEVNILIADDDPEAVRLIVRMLTALPHPYHFLRAYDGSQALRLMRETVPDVAFIDLIMPNMSGQETIQAMQHDDRLASVPVVIVSAQDQTNPKLDRCGPITVTYDGGWPLTMAARCINALLDALKPDYLVGTVQPQ